MPFYAGLPYNAALSSSPSRSSLQMCISAHNHITGTSGVMADQEQSRRETSCVDFIVALASACNNVLGTLKPRCNARQARRAIILSIWSCQLLMPLERPLLDGIGRLFYFNLTGVMGTPNGLDSRFDRRVSTRRKTSWSSCHNSGCAASH